MEFYALQAEKKFFLSLPTVNGGAKVGQWGGEILGQARR
jgi:hypothetical protein